MQFERRTTTGTTTTERAGLDADLVCVAVGAALLATEALDNVDEASRVLDPPLGAALKGEKVTDQNEKEGRKRPRRRKRREGRKGRKGQKGRKGRKQGRKQGRKEASKVGSKVGRKEAR
jgi:flagellar biosynthesis/type III secretory pathway protein FliH